MTDSTVSQDAPEPVAYTLLPLWTLLPEPKGSNFLKAVLAYMQALLPMGQAGSAVGSRSPHTACQQCRVCRHSRRYARLNDSYLCQPLCVRGSGMVRLSALIRSKGPRGLFAAHSVVCRIVLTSSSSTLDADADGGGA